jgi:hypothetical protein
MIFYMPLAKAERILNRSYEEMKRRLLVMELKWVVMHPHSSACLLFFGV